MSEPDQGIPNGYRQALVTAITVIVGFSLYFFRFWGFEADGDWTIYSIITQSILLAAIVIQLFALWRSLRLADDKPKIYETTVSWFMAGVGMALVAVTLAVVGYSGVFANP